MLKRYVLFAVISFLFIASPASFAEKAPGFKLPTGKSSISLSSYRGKKLVYVDFWASWCGPCRKSFPWMTDIQKRYRKHLKVIAINLDQDRADAFKFLKQTPAGFTVAYDPEGKIAEAYDVRAMPSSYLIDHRGNIVSKHEGFRSKNKKQVEAEIAQLLSKKK